MTPASRRADDAVRIPAGLTGPVEVALAKSAEQIPGPDDMMGGSWYEPKWDGFRAILIRREGEARLWSRNGNDLTASFPDVAAAAVQQLPEGVVLDGELVILADNRLSFDALQRRLATGRGKRRSRAVEHPASYVAFDLLSINGVDLRTQRWTARRQRLAALAATWRPPLQLTPVTDDVDQAQLWYETLGEMGIEGLVVKGAGTRYVGGSRSWVKVRRRETREVIVGGVLGPITRPDVVIAGQYSKTGELLIVGRTVPLTTTQSAQLGAVLSPAGPDHPWPDEITSYRWGGKDALKPLTKVTPVIVAEVAVDPATQAGQARHSLRYIRLRPDLGSADLEPMDR